MAIKVKELKDDALVDVKISKNYYMMLKATLYYLFSSIEESERENRITTIKDKKYVDMDQFERSFYTLTLLIAEIEKIALEQDLYEEKEILEPTDEGYIPPTQV
jgi:hypothetical protein